MLNWLNRILRRRVERQMPLDLEAIKRDEQLKALSQQLRSAEALLGEKQIQEREEREKQRQKPREEEFKRRLLEQEKEIKAKKTENTFSFKNFFLKAFTNKGIYKTKEHIIEVVDKNDEQVLGIFGDIMVLGEDLAIISAESGMPIVKGKDIRHIIHKPETLFNQIRRGKISIPYILDQNKQFAFLPDLENLEINDITRNPKDDEFEETEEKSGKVRDLLINRDKTIRKQRQKIETLENINIGLKAELDDIVATYNVKKNELDNYKSRFSEAVQSITQSNSRIGEIMKQNNQLVELKSLNEQKLMALDHIIKELLTKATGLGVKTQDERMKESIINDLFRLKEIVPETIVQNIQPEPKENIPTMPGQSLGRQNTEVK